VDPIGGKIAPLTIIDDVESESGIEVRQRQDGLEQQNGLGQGEGGCVLFELESQANQEEMRQDPEGHMMVPARPRAGLIITEADFLFTFLKAGFQRPTHAAVGLQQLRRGWARSMMAPGSPVDIVTPISTSWNAYVPHSWF
jgi:hypothetical protein